MIAPSSQCPLCPRLAGFRDDNKVKYPEFFNGAVPAFGGMGAELLVVGLAPGLKGANATGRPFTGDYAGEILYTSLLAFGFAKGDYQRHAGDGMQLVNCRITNAVRCVPQENKPESIEIKQCNAFLRAEIDAMPHLKAILSLGGISHKAVLTATGHKQSAFAFAHGAVNRLERKGKPSILLFDSYHCSRYNINTNRLSQSMFDKVVQSIQAELGSRNGEV